MWQEMPTCCSAPCEPALMMYKAMGREELRSVTNSAE